MTPGRRDDDGPPDLRTAHLFATDRPAGPAGEATAEPARPAAAAGPLATTRKLQDTDATRPVTPSAAQATWPVAPGLPEGIAAGQVLFDKYLVERPLGRGGMGSVWLVRQRELDVQRALKLIVPAFAIDPEIRARFRREARVMAKFTHPHVVAVHDARLTEGVAFIEMEYVRGRSLNTLLHPGAPMPLDWIARILAQLCDVLHLAHEQQIVHRDLKPSNLMLLDGLPPGQEHLKVLDFGIAKFLDPGGGDEDPAGGGVLTSPGLFLGTMQYASPEQAGGGRVDGRSDLYSVGVILYELLAGCRPFSGPAILYDHAVTPPPPITGRVPGVTVPPAIEALVLRCLAKDPADRPRTARELAEAFRRALPDQEGSGEAIPVTRWAGSPAGRPGRRRAPRLGLALAGGLLGVAAGSLIFRKAGTPGTSGSTAGGTGAKLGATIVATVPPRPAAIFPPRGFRVAAGTDRPGERPAALVCERDGSRLVRVEGGTFAMGHLDGFETFPDDDATAHPATVPTFYMQETEVTNGQLAAYFAETNPSGKTVEALAWKKGVDDDLLRVGVAEDEARRHPATRVSHQTAERYARWAGGLLPTEAEWEFAARSGGMERLYVWPAPTPPTAKLANIDTLGELTAPDGGSMPTRPVKFFESDRTEQGLFDLTGNVREWCRDPWPPDGPGPPAAPGQVPTFAVRGGAFDTPGDGFRTTGPRGAERGDQLAGNLGFRIVVECP